MNVTLTIARPKQTATAPDGREGQVDEDTGSLWVPTEDGGLEELAAEDWQPKERRARSKHYDNLADVLDPNEVARLGDEVWRGVTADEQSREEYLQMTADAIRMLGLRIDMPRSDAGGSGAPLEGMSTVRHPLLLEACLGFQSDFRGEMLPANGPCKVRNDATASNVTPETAEALIQKLIEAGVVADGMADALRATAAQVTQTPSSAGLDDELAAALEKDFNHFLTTTATEYYPDTDRAAFITGLMGCTFKKIYNCPLRRRPASESISAKDLIVDAGVTDLANAPRVTHQITMLPHEVLQLQEAGVYSDMPLGQPMHNPDAVEQAEAEALGYDRGRMRPEDRPHTIWECYTRANIRGLDDDAGKVPRPYKVSIDKDTRAVYEIRRNWRPDDEDRNPRRMFVKYPFVPALGFYDIGLMHILGNTTMALTASWRLNLDSMMFSNFPGFLYADVLGKQLTNVFRVPPGGGVPIQTTVGQPIANSVMPLPYKGPSAAGMELTKNIAETAARVGARPNIPTGEGTANTPAATVLASIIEATKLVGAVFKRLHGAQAEEFDLLKERFRDDPEAFWRHNKRPARKWEQAELIAALNDCDLVPAADPNTPSQLHRVMQGMAVFQMAQAAPLVFKVPETAEWLLRTLGVSDPDALLKNPQQYAADMAAQAQAQQRAAPGGHPPSPAQDTAAVLKAQAAAKTAETKGIETVLKAQETQAGIGLTEAQTAKTHAETQNMGEDVRLRAQDKVVESQDRAADRSAQMGIDLIRAETERAKLANEMAKHADDHDLAERQAAKPTAKDGKK